MVLGTGGWWAVAGDAARADSGRAVAICCAWGNRLADGVLTFSVTGDDPTALSIIRQAVQAWDDTLPELSFSEVTTRPDKADIVITYGPGTADGGEAPSSTGARGLTTTYMNTRRLVHKVEIGIDGGPAPVSAGAIEEIAKHELGHALGSGHANWDGDLMSPLVNPTPAPIPACDINAVRVANSWKMSDHARRAKPAPATSTPC
ncbi:MAG TPA: matrixin family metalloprotease [Acidimicrobiia bacterium]|nr:matrixin family metalloprotease [Acidimicrobiia bacterium]